jgi:hypothetical protein
VKRDAESLDGLRADDRWLGMVKGNDMVELAAERSSPQGRSWPEGCVRPLYLTARIAPAWMITRGVQRRRDLAILS